jgi:hypothetical protein
MASTSLQDFVKEQKTKTTHSPSSQSLASLQSGFTDWRSKLSTSLSSFELPLLGRSKNDVAVDFETPNGSGQLPSSQNRKNTQSGWMGGLLSSDDAFGLTRTQRVLGFFMCLIAGVFCFGLVSSSPNYIFTPTISPAGDTVLACYRTAVAKIRRPQHARLVFSDLQVRD